MSQNLECPHCGKAVSSRENDFPEYHPLHESYEPIYGTICGNCGRLINPLLKPGFVEENDLRLKLLRQNVRESIRKVLKKRMESKNGDIR